jgi:NADH:ubiquinone oxidoreductase subunit 4 (subunit M)
MITLLLLIPLLGSVCLFAIAPENKTTLKQVALTTSLINLFLSIYL